MNAAINAHSAKALRSAYFCYFLAALVMLTTCWFIWQGIEASEPDSPARSSKIVSGVLLVFLEGCAFSIAGQWREYSLQLRLLGWAIFGLQIVTMTLSNYSVGSTASKAAAASKDTLAEYKAQGAAAREAAKSLQADADNMRKSKHQWKRDEAGKKSDEAAKQTAAAAGVAEKMERLQSATVSSPVIDKLGETWYLVLSCVWSAIFEVSSIVLMSTAGGLRRKADAGALPVDQQILELLHKIHGAPVAPVAPVATVATVTPSISYGKTMPMLAGGALAAMAAPMTHAAPVAAANSASVSVQDVASVSVQDVASVSVQDVASVSVQKTRTKRAASVKVDTGVEGVAGARYKRIKAAVLAGKIKPTQRGIMEVEGGSQAVVSAYLEQLAADGVIIKAGRGYALAANKGGEA